MTDKLKPTAEQIQRACDMANRGRSRALWFPASYGSYTMLTYIADTLAELDAEKQISADTLARAEKAEADLRRVDEIAVDWSWGVPPNGLNGREEAAAIATPYRVKTDPLVEALEATGDDDAIERAWRLRAQLFDRGYELTKRGLEIGRSA